LASTIKKKAFPSDCCIITSTFRSLLVHSVNLADYRVRECFWPTVTSLNYIRSNWGTAK